MIILGISAYYHDSAVALIKDGTILFAAQEERYTRKKNDASFPVSAIQAMLKETTISLSAIDTVVYYEKPFLKFERILNTYIQDAPKGLRSFIQAMHVWTKEKLFIKQKIYKQLQSIDCNVNKEKIKLLFSEHHLSHAASTFYASPFNEAAILTIDGVGEYATTSLAIGNKNSISILKEIHFPHSIGMLYSAITYFLGFRVNSDEYKVMGLAAYGNGNAAVTQHYISIIESELIQFFEDGSYALTTKNFSFTHGLTMVNDVRWQQLFGIKKRLPNEELTENHAHLAYAFQKVCEKAVVQLCFTIKQLTNTSNLCLAGGVALNCVINGIIKQQAIFDEVFIQPASGDAGGALGAALSVYYMYYQQERIIRLPDILQNSLLGNSIDSNELQYIRTIHTKHEIIDDFNMLCNKVVQYITDGKVIGWVQGRMEFGPRALGNRSIIADARNETMQLHLNLKIKNRESFRPFAPIVMEEEAHKYFNIKGTSPYMLEVYPINETIRKTIPEDYYDLGIKEKLYTVKSELPAITHVDFTARIQTVNRQQHPRLWHLLSAFKQHSGVGVLINTSFNGNNEPIVATAMDAYNCFNTTSIDVLVIENCIFIK